MRHFLTILLLLLSWSALAQSTYVQQTQLTVGAVIQQQNLSANSCSAPCSGQVATIATVCSTPAACNSPSYVLSTTAPGCTANNAAKNADFLVPSSGNTLSVNPSGPDIAAGGLPAGTYPLCIQTNQTGNIANPGQGFSQNVTVNPAGTSAVVTVNGNASGSTVSTGSTMTVAISGGPGNQFDLWQVCSTLVDPLTCWQQFSQYLVEWGYLNCGHTTPSGPPYPTGTSPTCVVPTPTTTGNFAVQFMSNGAHDAAHQLAQATFSATAGTGSVSITSVAVSPNSVSTGFTGTVGTLSTTCSAACPGTAAYAIPPSSPTPTGCTAADAADNVSFTVPSGTANLNTTGSGLGTARTYRVCVTDTMSGATNSGNGFPLAVTVTAPTGPSITVNGNPSGATVTPGASMTVAVANGGGTGYDNSAWMGICQYSSSGSYSHSVCDGAGYAWAWVNSCGQGTASGSVAASNSCTLAAPNVTGNYVAAFFPNQSSYTPIATAPFSVSGGAPTITVNNQSNATVSAGSSPTFAWSNGPQPGQDANSWVGICDSGPPFSSAACDGAGYSWGYVNNNCSHTAGATVSNSGQCNMPVPSPATTKTYYAVWFPQITYDGGSGGGGTGGTCGDADNSPAAGVTWPCDTTQSADFDKITSLPSVYSQHWNIPATTTGACTVNQQNAQFTNEGIHTGEFLVSGSYGSGTYNFRPYIMNSSLNFSGDFYVEYKRRITPSGVPSTDDTDFWFESSGGAFQGYSVTGMEIDMPEFGGWARIIWGGATVSFGGGTRLDDGGGWANINNATRDGNWHTVGMKRLSGNYYLYIDGVQQNTYNHGISGNYIDGTQIEVTSGVMYPYGTNTVFTWMSWYAGGNGGYYCPSQTTDSTMQYVHAYHP